MEQRPAAPSLKVEPTTAVHRQQAYRARVLLEAATEAADLALMSTHARLAEAVAALGPSSATRLRDLLREPSDRNLSTRSRHGLCSMPETGLVSDLHTTASGGAPREE